ncbi:PaaI family thioesterase [bacterium]|nr:PaaI family thioesterase [bacterium]
MNDLEKTKKLQSQSAPCGETLGLNVLRFQSEPPEIEIEFEAKYEFTHSEGQIVQGGFVAAMLDAPMAHLLMGLFEEPIVPMTLDINVSYLAPSKPGKLNCVAEVVQLGKSTAFMSSRLYQEEKLVATATSTVKIVPIKS